MIKGLAAGLSSLTDGDETYEILCPLTLADILRPSLSDHVTLLHRPPVPSSAKSTFKEALGRFRAPAGRVFRYLAGRKPQGLPTEVPRLDPFVAAREFDVLHFTYPMHYATGAARSVFTLHDLQHERFPEYFTRDHVAYRRMLYGAAMRDCAILAVSSRFTAGEVTRFHGIPAEQIDVVHLPPLIGAAGSGSGPAHALPAEVSGLERFILYPAVSYVHKNHAGLLRALSHLEKTRGLKVPMVFTGARTPQWEKVIAEWRRLDPRPEFVDLGFVTDAVLGALFKHAAFLVFPSKFEGAGLPLTEAFQAGIPVACSRLEPFVEYAHDAPVYFSPESAEEMAEAIFRLWTDPAEGERCVREGRRQIEHLSWPETARSYRALYRRAAANPDRI